MNVLVVGLLAVVAPVLIPASWFLSWLGFGAAGPVAGMAAPFLQRVFFGAGVSAGSWFAQLQAAATGAAAIPLWFEFITKVPLVLGGLFWTAVVGLFAG